MLVHHVPGRYSSMEVLAHARPRARTFDEGRALALRVRRQKSLACAAVSCRHLSQWHFVLTRSAEQPTPVGRLQDGLREAGSRSPVGIA